MARPSAPRWFPRDQRKVIDLTSCLQRPQRAVTQPIEVT